jgi:TonB-linked SusC/RagA family outer membrane protein
MKNVFKEKLHFLLKVNRGGFMIFKIILLILLFTTLNVTAGTLQKVKITGVVTDGSTGGPLVGVNVTIEGTTIGVMSGLDGKYVIEAEKNDGVMVFSFIGFVSQRVNIQGKTEINVTLISDVKALEEVVVVGYGTQKKVNLTGSVSSISSVQLTDIPITQTTMALQGKMAGVTITQNFGAPGSDGGTIRIRGIGTLGQNDPLVLVDGVEGTMNDINPNDIENISVLKDAASASIYGSRAANGVILIKTKRGNKNAAMSITYNGMIAIQVPTDLPKLVDGPTYMMLKNENERNSGRTNLYSDAYISTYKENIGIEPYFNTDWFKFAMKPSAVEQQHSLTVSGGSDMITSLVSVSYLDQDALIENAGLKRWSLRFNNTLRATNKLSFTLDGFLRREDNMTPSQSISSLFQMMCEIPPLYPGIWADGSYGEGWNGSNPLGFMQKGGSSISVSSRLQLNIRANYEIFKWLNLDLGYAPKYLTTNSKVSVKQYTYKKLDGSTGIKPDGLNSLSNTNVHSLENFYQAILRFNKSFGQHTASALFGFESNDYRSDNFTASRQNFLLPQYEVLDVGDANYKNNSGSATEWALASFFGRVNYSLADRYLFEANLRYDGSSRFAEAKRWGMFPSFSAGWRIKQESFMTNIDFISDLKIRASWGQLGNQNIANYPYLGVINISQPYYFGKTVVSGAAQTVLANKNVAWETTTILDGGIDFGLFNNRLTGSLDIYKKNTINILYVRDIPAVIGLTASEQNIAKVQNIGWDLQFGWKDDIKDFKYGVDIVVSDVKNKVLDLFGKPQYGRNVIFENQEYQAFYGYECIGIYRSQEDLDKYPRLNSNYKLGDLIFKDLNNDGKIDPTNDKKIIGSNIPRFNFGTTLSFGYKNFDLSVFFQGVGKKNIYFSTRQAGYSGSYYDYQLGRLIPDDPTTYQTATWIRVSDDNVTPEDNSFFLFNAAYLRCKNLIVGYSIPKQILKKLNIAGARFYISGQNLVTWDKLKINFIDPEAPSSASGAMYYPNTKTFAFGVDLKF